MMSSQKKPVTCTAFAASALALVVSAQAMAGTVTTDGPDITIKTKGGFEAAAVDKSFHLNWVVVFKRTLTSLMVCIRKTVKVRTRRILGVRF